MLGLPYALKASVSIASLFLWSWVGGSARTVTAPVKAIVASLPARTVRGETSRPPQKEECQSSPFFSPYTVFALAFNLPVLSKVKTSRGREVGGPGLGGGGRERA